MKSSILFLVIWAALSGCDSSSGGGGGGGNDKLREYTTPQNYAMVVGTVRNAGGAPVDEVDVSVGAMKVKTNNQGYFALERLPELGDLVVRFEKAGFVHQSRTLHTRVGESSFVEVTLAPMSPATSFPAAAGADVRTSGARVTIPPGALRTPDGREYGGDARLSVTVFDPSSEAGMKAFPGSFEGVQRDGNVIPFRSLGFADITPTTAAGIPLQLAPGAEADLEMPISAQLQASAPPELPLWYFNPGDGKWHEEGVAVRNGAVYAAKVRHFSIWNCDVGLRRAYVMGRVVNCSEDGRPVKAARVTIQNNLAGWSSGESSTPEDGTFRIPVNASEPVTLWAAKGGQKSQPKSFTAPGRDQTYDVGDVCLGVPKVQIVLTWGLQPVDLDAHLSIPTPGSRAHVFFGNKSAGNANLDTDDTTSFGPEIVTLFKLLDGTYRYSVHHYGGEGSIATSKAHVNMIIDGLGIFQMDPPGTSGGKGDLWSLWDFEVRGGRVINIIPNSRLILQKDVNSNSVHPGSP